MNNLSSTIPAGALALVLSLALTGSRLHGQAAVVAGSLVDRTTGIPVEGARINILGTGLGVSSDTGGRFELAGVPPGIRVIQVRAIGYAVGSWMVELGDGQVLRQVFELAGRPVEVDPVTVTVRNDDASWRSEAAFDRRRANARGFFITRQDIQERRAASLSDLLRAAPGVIVQCRGMSGCKAQMGRAAGCNPEYFLDGYPATFATGPRFPVQQLRGIEIYTNVNDVPTEYQRPGQRCGVIAIWTIEPGTRLERY